MQKKHDRQADGSLPIPGKLSGTISTRSLLNLMPIPAWHGPDHGICCHFHHISMGFLWSAKASFGVSIVYPSGNVAPVLGIRRVPVRNLQNRQKWRNVGSRGKTFSRLCRAMWMVSDEKHRPLCYSSISAKHQRYDWIPRLKFPCNPTSKWRRSGYIFRIDTPFRHN